MSEGRKAFGQELTRLRTERGVGLDELASATKVRVVLLRALEEGRFESLPPAVFVEGYLKACARYLGADPGQFVKRYRILAGVPSESPVPAPAPVSNMPRTERRTRPAFKWMGVAILVGGLGYTSYFLVRQMESSSAGEPPGSTRRPAARGTAGTGSDHVRAGEPPAASAPGPVAESPQPEERTDGVMGAPGLPAEGSESPPMSASSPMSSAAPQLPSAAPQGDLTLATDDLCWCEIWADGKRVLYRQVSPGERLGFSGDRFKVSLGNAGAVDLRFRGASVPLPAEPGRVVTGLELPSPEEALRP
jgi:cytoskeleton protein RodZ